MAETTSKGVLATAKSIPMLETSKDWDFFERNVDSWTINEDLDDDKPESVAAGNKWDRKQLKGVKALLTRCGTRAYGLGKEELTIYDLINTLRAKFEDKEEGTFGEAYNTFYSLDLHSCTNLDDYNTQFDTKYERMCEFAEVEICRPLLVKRYLEGLGPAFQSWLSTFNQSHAILKSGDVEGVTLAQAQSSAKVESNKMTTSDISSAALVARQGNNKRPQQYQPSNTKRTKTATFCKVHRWCSHNDEACITQHPELEASWRAREPAAAAARDANIRSTRSLGRPDLQPQGAPITATASVPLLQSTGKLAYASIDENKF